MMRIHNTGDHQYNRSYRTVRGIWQGVGGGTVPDILYPLHGRRIASRFHYQAPDCTLQ